MAPTTTVHTVEMLGEELPPLVSSSDNDEPIPPDEFSSSESECDKERPDGPKTLNKLLTELVNNANVNASSPASECKGLRHGIGMMATPSFTKTSSKNPTESTSWMGRTGHFWFYFDVQVHEQEIDDDASISRPVRRRSNSHRPEDVVFPTTLKINLKNAAAQREARELAIHLGRSSDTINGQRGWPVVWGEDNMAYLFTPRPNGELFIDTPDNPYKLIRALAIIVLYDCWDEFRHVGQAPVHSERLSVHNAANSDTIVTIDYKKAVAELAGVSGEGDKVPGSRHHMAAAVHKAVTTILVDTGA